MNLLIMQIVSRTAVICFIRVEKVYLIKVRQHFYNKIYEKNL